jgi:hypothetical protein
MIDVLVFLALNQKQANSQTHALLSVFLTRSSGFILGEPGVDPFQKRLTLLLEVVSEGRHVLYLNGVISGAT